MQAWKKVNKEVIEILDKQLGYHGKRDSLWSLAIDLDKIQVRPDLEGHAVELGVTPKPLKHRKNLCDQLVINCHTIVTQLSHKTVDIYRKAWYYRHIN